jgi:hypothetical protein
MHTLNKILAVVNPPKDEIEEDDPLEAISPQKDEGRELKREIEESPDA